MKNYSITLLLLLFTLLFSSCSKQIRHTDDLSYGVDQNNQPYGKHPKAKMEVVTTKSYTVEPKLNHKPNIISVLKSVESKRSSNKQVKDGSTPIFWVQDGLFIAKAYKSALQQYRSAPSTSSDDSKNTLAMLGFISGILGILFLFAQSLIALLSLLFAILAIILSALSLNSDKKILAILGLTFGILVILIYIFIIILIASLFK